MNKYSVDLKEELQRDYPLVWNLDKEKEVIYCTECGNKHVITFEEGLVC